MKPTLCIIIGGTPDQVQDYVESCEKVGDVEQVFLFSDLLEELDKGKYVIYNPPKSLITHAIITGKKLGAQVVGISFEANELISGNFDKLIYMGDVAA